jgi:hypothetical protein
VNADRKAGAAVAAALADWKTKAQSPLSTRNPASQERRRGHQLKTMKHLVYLFSFTNIVICALNLSITHYVEKVLSWQY